MAKRKRYRKSKKQPTVLEIVSAVVVLIAALIFYLYGGGRELISPDADAEVHFIDVGQGDGTMILSDEVCVVVDCGTYGSADDFTEYIKSYTDKIDCLVLSHAHEDHMGGAAELIREVEVREVVMTSYASDAAFFSYALDAIEDTGAVVTEAVAGESHTVGDVTLEYLSPSRDYGDFNNNSIVMRLTVDGSSVLFTGDAEDEAESDILKRYGGSLSSHILKVGHHGSSSSTTEKFFLAVNPDYAVISCGKDNSYGHPHRETVALLEKYGTPTYRTDEAGDLVFTVKNGKIYSPDGE